MIEDYAKIEIAKQAVKAQKLQEELLAGKMTDADVSLWWKNYFNLVHDFFVLQNLKRN